MTDQEIDKWVVEQIHIPPPQPMKADFPKLFVKAIIKWGQNIAHTFYKLGKDDRLTWQDIKKIVNIADAMLDDPKMRIAVQNHSEEEYYQKVLDEYNRLHQTKA